MYAEEINTIKINGERIAVMDAMQTVVWKIRQKAERIPYNNPEPFADTLKLCTEIEVLIDDIRDLYFAIPAMPTKED
jgi:hypothetical protein